MDEDYQALRALCDAGASSLKAGMIRPSSTSGTLFFLRVGRPEGPAMTVMSFKQHMAVSILRRKLEQDE